MPATTPLTRLRVRGCDGSPNESAFIAAIGRAPMVKTSRRMPPTPVAAPWYGSMYEGWLWLSILKTSASPSPISTTPAFSPGPQITCGPEVGRVRSHRFDDLYEQCSFHIAEKIPSSVSVGVRPIRSRMRWYSSGFSPCAATSASVTSGSRRRVSDIGAPGLARPPFRARLRQAEGPTCSRQPPADGYEKKGRALARPKSNREVEEDTPEGGPTSGCNIAAMRASGKWRCSILVHGRHIGNAWLKRADRPGPRPRV